MESKTPKVDTLKLKVDTKSKKVDTKTKKVESRHHKSGHQKKRGVPLTFEKYTS